MSETSASAEIQNKLMFKIQYIETSRNIYAVLFSIAFILF